MRRKKSTPESSNSLIKELSSVEFIKQPYLYAMVGADFSLYQRSIMIEIVKSMQDRINEFLKNKRADGQMSLFPKDLSDDQIVTFRISASSIGVSPRDYVYLDEACKNLMEMNISYYDYDQMGRKMRTYAHLFSTIKMPVTPVSGSKEKEKRMNYVEARMDAKILKYLCDLGNGKGYLDHIYRIARICKRKRTPSIYIYLSRWKDFPKKTVEYVELKKFLGVITLEEEKLNGKMVNTEKDKYPKFSKFCKEVMDPIREDLDRMATENLVDFTFDYEPVYKGATKRGNPDEILFNIKLSELGEEMSRKRRQQKLPADIWDLLRSEYKLTETDVRMLTDMLPDELMNEFRSEVLALRDRMNRYKVNNPKSYVVTSLKNFIIQHTPEAKGAKEDERVGEKKETPHTKPISEEDKNRWQAFMELLQGSVSVNEFKTWLSSLEFVSLKGDEVTVSVPAAYVATYIDEKLSTQFKQALNAVYGEDVKLLYEVRK
jgi:hypothetical protein